MLERNWKIWLQTGNLDNRELPSSKEKAMDGCFNEYINLNFFVENEKNIQLITLQLVDTPKGGQSQNSRHLHSLMVSAMG